MPTTTLQRATRAGTGIALAVIVTCQLMVVLDATVVNIALVPIQHTLHFSTANLSWVIDAYSLAFGGLLLLGGRAGDVFGRRRMLMIGLSVFTIASMLGGVASSATWLIATRAIQGVGAALAAPSTLSLISATFREGPERNRALGVFSAVSAGGGSLGLILGGALTSWISWRWVFFINVPIGLAIIVLAPRFIVEPPRNGGKIDVAGAALVTAGLSGVTYAFIRLAERGSATGVALSFIAGALLLWAFVKVEQRQARPLLPMRIVTHRLRGPSYLAMLAVPAAMYGVFFFISQYLEADLHFDAIKSGFAFLPLTGIIFACSRVTPRLIARFNARPILLTGLAAMTVASLMISRATPSHGYVASLLVPLALFGFGAGFTFLPLSAIILAGVPRDDAGAASGMLQTMQQTGAALGVAALSSVATTFNRGDALVVGGILTALALLGAFFYIRPGTQGSHSTSEESAEEMLPLLLSE